MRMVVRGTPGLAAGWAAETCFCACTAGTAAATTIPALVPSTNRRREIFFIAWRSTLILSSCMGGCAGRFGGGGLGGRFRFRQSDFVAQRGVDTLADFRMLLEEHARILAALTQAFTGEAEPGAGFLDDSLLRAQIDQVAFPRDALAIQNIHLGFAERRRNFILH